MTYEVLQQLIDDPIHILNRGYRAKERIAARQERIKQWRQIAESITANPENSSSGGGYPSSKVENCVASIVDLQAEIQEEIQEITSFEGETSSIIHDYVVEPNYKAVLEYRYLNYYRWEEIAVKTGFTFRWTQELHRRALAELKEMAAAAKSALVPERMC